jgi:hypothetical protein
MNSTWFRAFRDTVFQFACLHLLLIAIQALRTGDYKLVHMASILDLNFWFQNVPYTLLSNLLLFIPIVVVFFINFRRSK